jgi:hypothetical protein
LGKQKNLHGRVAAGRGGLNLPNIGTGEAGVQIIFPILGRFERNFSKPWKPDCQMFEPIPAPGSFTKR